MSMFHRLFHKHPKPLKPLKKWCVRNVDCAESWRLRAEISSNILQLRSLCDAPRGLEVRMVNLKMTLHDTQRLGVPDHKTKFKIYDNGYVNEANDYREITSVHVVEDLQSLIFELQTALTATRKEEVTEKMIQNTVAQCIASVNAFIAYIMRDFYPRSRTGQQPIHDKKVAGIDLSAEAKQDDSLHALLKALQQ